MQYLSSYISSPSSTRLDRAGRISRGSRRRRTRSEGEMPWRRHLVGGELGKVGSTASHFNPNCDSLLHLTPGSIRYTFRSCRPILAPLSAREGARGCMFVSNWLFLSTVTAILSAPLPADNYNQSLISHRLPIRPETVAPSNSNRRRPSRTLNQYLTRYSVSPESPLQ